VAVCCRLAANEPYCFALRTRRALTDGLRSLLTRWEGEAPPQAEAVDDELTEASDEDMFDLIDRELGIG
ncbi:hypothetical protein, partial [Streptomyces sp. NPDC005407]|uniref:hypothetical protein n=1 Tax=Streptomyces sp. NPDC005407 TaxID=3155340 RepID=UPI0033A4AD35